MKLKSLSTVELRKELAKKEKQATLLAFLVGMVVLSVALVGCASNNERATQSQSLAQAGTIFAVSDSRDLKLLRMAEGSKMDHTTLPSGKVVPTPPEGKEWRVRKGKLVLEDCKQTAQP